MFAHLHNGNFQAPKKQEKQKLKMLILMVTKNFNLHIEQNIN